MTTNAIFSHFKGFYIFKRLIARLFCYRFLKGFFKRLYYSSIILMKKSSSVFNVNDMINPL